MGTDSSREIPVAEAAVRLGLTREQIIRLIQRRKLEGGLRGGRWFATAQSVEQLVRERALVPVPVA